jgi:hypothetical protein
MCRLREQRESSQLLNAHGNPIEHYSELNLEMSRKKLEQRGAINQFLA